MLLIRCLTLLALRLARYLLGGIAGFLWVTTTAGNGLLATARDHFLFMTPLPDCDL